MEVLGLRAKVRVALLVVLVLCVGLAGLYGLLKPVSNGCNMTYMYPTYIPIPFSSSDAVPAKYGLYLYHEGWKSIDFKEHVRKLSGVPVLFIPGNGGSYKQVRSLAAESDKAYQAGPLDRTFYREAWLSPEEGGEEGKDVPGSELPNQYDSRLDWFTADLAGEHSAMDSGVLEEQAHFVVLCIHRILDQYKESFKAREREGAATSATLPKGVILVGHSMGGFVARAATIDPQLRKSAVETILTLSSPHQYPPLALQPSYGHYFRLVNQEWRKGYEVQTTAAGHYLSDPVLSNVVVISISGGYNDYQVRTKYESLDGIVPPTHGFMISSTGMKNVWLSMEHQVIIWCNQLVIQVSHTLLSLADSRTGQPFSDRQVRLAIFSKMLRSAIPQSFNWKMQSQLSQQSIHAPTRDVKDRTESLFIYAGCPGNVHWSDDGLERDLYIQTTTVTVLAMDGRRRWLDIRKLGSNGRSHFMFVTNLAPCSGVRLHLWPEKGNSTSDLPVCTRILDVTSRMVLIPSGPAPRQIEPGSQTEQAPPSAILCLGPKDMHGFRFLTISVAPRPSISGRPPPAVSMAVGQFFNPKEGEREISPWSPPLSGYSHKVLSWKEDHPLALNLSFTSSLGLLPVKFSLKTAGCGIKTSGPDEQPGDIDNSKLCKLRCFPPVAFAWDETSGLHVFTDLYSDTIVVDSSASLWSSPRSSEKTSVMLVVDPHCSYTSAMTVSVTAVASRFLLVYNSQILGLSIVVIFFALMRQAWAWDSNLPIPSLLMALESNLRFPTPFLYLAIAPIGLSLFVGFWMSQPCPSFTTFTIVSVVCYFIANGFTAILILISQLAFYGAALLLIFIKKRFQLWGKSFQWFVNISSGFCSWKVLRVMRANPLLVTALAAITLACLVHPALGLLVLLCFHAFHCHTALCSYLTASFRIHARRHESFDYKKDGNNEPEKLASKHVGISKQNFPSEDTCSNSPDSSKSFGETQLELFHHRHGVFILHLTAALMFGPSFVTWLLERIGTDHSFPWVLDAALSTGVILHGIFTSHPQFNSFLVSFPPIRNLEVRMHLLYLFAGIYSYLSSLALAPYREFCVMAAVGYISIGLTLLQRWKGDAHFVSRKHSHRH